MEVTFSPCHSSSFIFSSEAPASEPVPQEAGGPRLGGVGQPQAEDLMFHVPRSVVRRARAQGGVGRGGGRSSPPLTHPQSRVGALPGAGVHPPGQC